MASTVTIGTSTVNVTVLRDEPAVHDGANTVYWILDRSDPVVSVAPARYGSGQIVFQYSVDLQTALLTGGLAVFDSDCPAVVPDRTMSVTRYTIGPFWGSEWPREMWAITVEYQAV